MRNHKKKKKSIIPPVLICVLGLAVVLYLPISDWQKTKTYKQELERYESLLQEENKTNSQEMLRRAREYNRQLKDSPEAFTSPEILQGYEEILSFPESDVMAYIEIPRINSKLPIYHGTDDGTLGDGIGHLEGSSFPVGGVSTHSVLVGHRGLSTASLFTRLDEMKKGDLFVITVLGDKLYYKVDQILIVEPDEIEELRVAEGKDYCTLLTCTPFGINTQRLLVRGERPAAPEEPVEKVTGFSIPPLYLWVIVIMGVLLLLVFGSAAVGSRKKKKRKKRKEMKR